MTFTGQGAIKFLQASQEVLPNVSIHRREDEMGWIWGSDKVKQQLLFCVFEQDHLSSF